MDKKTRKPSEFLSFLGTATLIIIIILIIVYGINSWLNDIKKDKVEQKLTKQEIEYNIEYNNDDILFKIKDKQYVNKYGYIKESNDLVAGILLNGIEVNSLKIDNEIFENLTNLYDIINNNDMLSKITSIDISNLDNIEIHLNSENKVIQLGNFENLNTKITYAKAIIEQEKGNTGTIFVNDTNKVYFKEN